jgi:hypothetical protein
MRPPSHLAPSVVGTAIGVFLLLIPGIAPAQKLVKIDPSVIPRAKIWIDGVPVFPPYILTIEGDTAFVINHRPVASYPLVSVSGKRDHTPSEQLSARAFEAMREALAAGLRDSAVTAAGCAVFNSDTSLAGVATLTPGGRTILLTKKGPAGDVTSYETVLPPRPRGPGAAENRQTTLEMLTGTYRATERILAHGSIQFFCHNGSCTMSIPQRFFPRLVRDVRDAALADSLSPQAWYRSVTTQPRLLDFRIADLIARNTVWEGL